MHPKKPFPNHSKMTFSPNTILHSIGPAGKLKGTAFQLIEKYTQLGKEAASDADMVLAQDCFQYAEHYKRLLHAFRHERMHPRPPYSDKSVSSLEESPLYEETNAMPHDNRPTYRPPHQKNYGNPSMKSRQPFVRHTHSFGAHTSLAEHSFSDHTQTQSAPPEALPAYPKETTSSIRSEGAPFSLENTEKKRARRKNKGDTSSDLAE